MIYGMASRDTSQIQVSRCIRKILISYLLPLDEDNKRKASEGHGKSLRKAKQLGGSRVEYEEK